MKIRNGFISNSSSSSFLVFGWKIDSLLFHRLAGKSASWDEAYDFFESKEVDYISDDNYYYVGNFLNLGEYGLQELSADFIKDLQDETLIKELKEKFKALNNIEPVYFGGTISD